MSTPPRRLVIASRESALAMWQARHVQAQLERLYPDICVEILGLTTTGDQILATPLASIGGKGLFIKELEQALEDGRADIAVHSMKDVPMTLPDGFVLAAISAREDARDAFVSVRYRRLVDLPEGSVVGTSSLRRQSQLMARLPHLNIEPLRGNLQTRLRKLDEGRYAAIILAAAGLHRLGLEHRITEYLAPENSIPAVGQGALGLEIRSDRLDLLPLLAPLNDPDSAACVAAERAMSRALAGSCTVPLGAYGHITAGTLHVIGFVASLDGREIVRAAVSGPPEEAELLGHALTKRLIAQGADHILAQLTTLPKLPLAGCGIAITRPQQQALVLAQLIRQQGGTPILFPLLAISPLDDYTACDTAIAGLGDCDWAIFISSNAVEYAMPRIRRQFQHWPQHVRCVAVGPGSAATLARYGIGDVSIPANRYDSEGLLALPEFQQIEGRRVIIFRGIGGRELLAQTLEQRGAKVVLAECYRRSNPQADAGKLHRLWQSGRLQALVVTSSEAMRNLLALAGAADWLRQTPICVNAACIAEVASQHGLKAVLADAPGDSGLLRCLLAACQT